MVLLGILSSVVLPRFFDSQTFTSFFNKSEFESALNWTRNRAITSQCAHEFRITSSGWYVLRDDDRDSATSGDCSSTTVQPSCSGNQVYNFIYRTEADVVSDGSNAVLSGSDISSATLRRLIFSTTGQLYELSALPADPAIGCTALTPSDRITNGATLLLDQFDLTADGATAYVAVQ